MECPTCHHANSRIIRTRPDPDCDSTDLVRRCKNPGCLAIFNTRETVLAVIDESLDKTILDTLIARIDALPNSTREKLIQALRLH